MTTPPDVSLVMMPSACLSALLEGDLIRAGDAIGLALPPFFLEEGWLWSIRLDQMTRDSATVGWLVHAVCTPQDVVVGHAGFHGPPDVAASCGDERGV